MTPTAMRCWSRTCEMAVAPAEGIAEAVAQCVRDRRSKRSAVAALVLAAWVGADERTGAIFEAARIPHFPTEDDAVRAFMYLVRYREASTALAATPPGVASVFTPETAAARHVVVSALSEDGRGSTRPRSSPCSRPIGIPIVGTIVADDAEDAAVQGGAVAGRGACRSR